MINRTKRYFFHNIYNKEQNLLNSLPNNYIAVPIGWDSETEEARDNILNLLLQDNIDQANSLTYSTMPDVLYWRPAYVKSWTYDEVTTTITNLGHWESLHLEDFSSNMTWEIIENRINNILIQDSES